MTAGGYDALFLLVLNEETTLNRLEKVWTDYKDLSVGPLLSRCDSKGLSFNDHIS